MTLKFALEPSNAEDILYTQAGHPTLDLRFASSKSLNDYVSGQNLITFTRASSGTYVGSDGLIKTALTDVPRFDHDPVTGESLGLLVEESRTNLLLRSDDLTTTWIKFGTTVSSNTATAPDGTSTADKLIDTANNGEHGIYQITPTSGSHTFSVFAKAVERRYIVLRKDSSFLLAVFDLQTGTVTQTDVGVTASITAYPNGWYRCSMTCTSTGNTVIKLSNVGTGVLPNSVYLGNGGGMLIWGAQLEAGDFLTSYIPTTDAEVTRSADVASITGTNFSSWYNASEGTSYFQAVPAPQYVAFQAMATFSGDSIADEWRLWRTSTTSVTSSGVVGGVVTLGSGVIYSPTSNGRLTFAGAIKADDAICAANGTLSTADTSGEFPTLSRLTIGSRGNNTFRWNGHISRLVYFDRRLGNDTLQAITSDTAPTTYGNLVLDSANTPQAIAGVAPTLDYRFARDKREIESVSLVDKLAFTGGDQGTFVGSDGYIQQATTNLPRFDHDPLSRISEGLLVEESRTNLLLRSEEFQTPGIWTPGGAGASITLDATTAPDGTNTADRMQATAGASGIQQVVNLALTPHTYSIYAKKAGADVDAIFRLSLGPFYLTFNLVTGTFSDVDPSYDPPTATQVGNGWWRISGTRTPTATANAIRVFSTTTDNVDVYLWGAQLEEGAFPTSYIHTTASAVTRTADSATIDGTGILTGTYTIVEKPAGCVVESGGDIVLQEDYTVERVMVFPAALSAGQITAIREAM